MKNLVLAGHYGSGKTQLCIHLALSAKREYGRVALCDLDIVNPYFRAVDCRSLLEGAGIRFIASAYAGGNAELPGFPAEAAAIFDDAALFAVVDLGGDERGALALGRYAGQSQKETEMLLVVNRYRPLTPEPQNAVEICREIERASRFRFTGIINNSNLGAETTADDVLASVEYAQNVSQQLGLPIRYTSVKQDLQPVLGDKVENLLPIAIFHKPEWRIEND